MTIAKDGTVYVADRNANRVQAFTQDGKFIKEGWVARPTPQGDFGTSFGVALSGDKQQRVFLRADKAVPYGELMALMNDLRSAGYLHVALVGLDKASQ